jgi:hypothetical protein
MRGVKDEGGALDTLADFSSVIISSGVHFDGPRCAAFSPTKKPAPDFSGAGLWADIRCPNPLCFNYFLTWADEPASQ